MQLPKNITPEGTDRGARTEKTSAQASSEGAIYVNGQPGNLAKHSGQLRRQHNTSAVARWRRMTARQAAKSTVENNQWLFF